MTEDGRDPFAQSTGEGEAAASPPVPFELGEPSLAWVMEDGERVDPDKRAAVLRGFTEAVHAEGGDPRRVIGELATQLKMHPALVVEVLRAHGRLSSDQTVELMVYEPYFRALETGVRYAEWPQVVKQLVTLLGYFERLNDRRGQHLCFARALALWNRLRWSGRTEDAELFWDWIVVHA